MSLGEGPSALPAPAVALVVLDGWGLAPEGPGNAVALARTPVFDQLWQHYPTTSLAAGGTAVGLPEGQMGNSEVGHLNLGAGAIVKQDLTRIDEAAAAGRLAESAVLRAAFEAVGDGGRVHLIGLVSDGGVHASIEHLRALIELGRELEVADLVVHAFSDGRDTAPSAGAGYLAQVQRWLAQAGGGRIGSVIGRFFAMDRDGRWERTQQAYDLLVHGTAAHHAEDAEAALRAAYQRGESDEFVTATTVGAEARIRPGDSVVAFNFRPDRMREIIRALAEPGFTEVDRGGAPPVAELVTMTSYSEDWRYPVAFPPARPELSLSSVLADAGARQLHVAETEKYPHVTYFFNGGEEQRLAGERRELVPSPRDVATYDQKPQMSASAAAGAFIAAWSEDAPRFGIINFANADMVGHSGDIAATVTAVETVDACLGEVVQAVHASGGVLLITADHGNADRMLEPDGRPSTAHSLNPVPVIVTCAGVALRDGGILADVAPTVLRLLGERPPAPMTGSSLLDS